MPDTLPYPPAPFVPAHVPAELVQEFDFYRNPQMSQCPFQAVGQLRGKKPIFWNPSAPQSAGCWVLTRSEDIRHVLTTPEIFSSKGEAGFSGLIGESWDMVPLEMDPPEHEDYRQLLHPLLTPKAVNKLAPAVIKRAVDLIEAVRSKGECEFMSSFGTPFPVGVFMSLMGLPESQMPIFLEWEYDLLHNPDMAVKATAALTIKNYLLELAAERRANPTDDLASFIVTAQINGEPLADDKVLGILYLFFVGGLDTVASSLGFFFRHLAEHPEQQAELRAHPEKIPHAVEEMVRRFSVVTSRRQCKEDVVLSGVQMKKGDWVKVNYALAGLDPEAFENPYEVNFERKNVRHFGFSFGPHFCLGSHLGRREMAIALQEWLARVPQWRLKPGAKLDVHGGGVFGIEHMELEWDVA